VCPPRSGDSAASAALPGFCQHAFFSWYLTRVESWWSGVMSVTITVVAGYAVSLRYEHGSGALSFHMHLKAHLHMKL
jgi:hypothetical protein